MSWKKENDWHYESTKALIEYFVKEYDARSFPAGTAIASCKSYCL